MKQRSRALWLATLAVLALQGCGVKLVYNNVDRIIPWYVAINVPLLIDIGLAETE